MADRPTGPTRLFFRSPELLARLRGPFARRFLPPTTRGRRSVNPRTCALTDVERDGGLCVFAGSGAASDWYRNVLADPRVGVRLGRRRWSPLARALGPVETGGRAAMSSHLAGRLGPPRPLRPVLKLLGFDFDAEVRAPLARPTGTPAVELGGLEATEAPIRAEEVRMRFKVRWILAGLALASVVREMRKPESERTWHDKLFGVVPYDWRVPTRARLRDAFWNPDDPRLFTDRPFGVGWSVNLYRAKKMLSARGAPEPLPV